MNKIVLNGCSPTPLAGYLKGLGVLRLVAEQADPAVRGLWENESFVLHTKLSKEELSKFFLEEYSPSPIIDPWNRGSGFLSKGDKAAKNLALVENSQSARFKPYIDGINAARNTPLFRDLKDVVRKENEFNKIKPSYIQQCRLTWRGNLLEWLDSALIIQSDLTPKYPSLLGSGGNDGRLDFTDNFRERLSGVIDISSGTPTTDSESLLKAALFSMASRGAGRYSIGQYLPGAAGGANSTSGIGARANVNPWDYILFLEGTILFASAATRRLNQASAASAPFSLYAQPAGHISSSNEDKATRGEQWMPLWAQPASLKEIRLLLAEGRSQLGRSTTKDPLEMGRAVARLGVARGISAFERYGYLERNGQANFAVPLGRWRVVAQPRQELLNDIDHYYARLRREARSDNATGALKIAVRNLGNAMLAAAANGSVASSWQNILLTLADIDAYFAAIPVERNRVGLLDSLSPGWIEAADDGTAEFRLALAYGTQYGVRRHYLPLNRFGRLDATASASVVCYGRDLAADSIAYLSRRIIEGSRDGRRELDQYAAYPISFADINAFIYDNLDEQKILSLARAFMALDHKAGPRAKLSYAKPELPDDGYSLLRLCVSARHWGSQIPLNANVFRRLASGDLTSAARAAAMHLRAHGLNSPIEMIGGNAKAMAAAISFPISTASYEAIINQFTIQEKGTTP